MIVNALKFPSRVDV